MFKQFLSALWLLFFLSSSAHAVLTIEITKGADSTLPIAIVPFGGSGQGAVSTDIAKIIRNDLARSGHFSPLAVASLPQQPVSGDQVNFPTWRTLATDYLLIGQVTSVGGAYNVSFQLFNIPKAEQVLGFSFPARNDNLRRIGHRISDLVYEALIGEVGAFDSRIAYVSVKHSSKKPYQLNIADMDGADAKAIFSSHEPILSPAWSPDGQKLAYVSLENKRNEIYVQHISSGKRESVAKWPGLNSAPAWSPDGQKLALTLSKDGNAEIYLLDLSNRRLQRLTFNRATDTEADWAPDGKSLVFTSDRGGKPQIYRISAKGGQAQRLSFSGSSNSRARFSPDGQKLALINGSQHGYRIAVQDLSNGQLLTLTQTTLDESPAFAPNGQMIIYATGPSLAAVSSDGQIQQRLAVAGNQGSVREPAWSPRLH
ncbi:Tol-Pal system beta propeller repeat protein TolB [Candidatus Venteria ishoeyi]|uniref:Tol-Pal system beta propeller repeat protein TolB n=1 Tax=Candidatus Venteria ishoeyi TaxID=1899563 RepID=UPI0025A64324|nr:Tol-Pal system beta propeller repeat protein TolB [Candidatus Venteria ishoeyi]MDM8546032.1 Tol-Pal system beta propeller repeat protein TolB [Candidatus Venteria ishoeyi]